jgi:hypothetical protein
MIAFLHQMLIIVSCINFFLSFQFFTQSVCKKIDSPYHKCKYMTLIVPRYEKVMLCMSRILRTFISTGLYSTNFFTFLLFPNIGHNVVYMLQQNFDWCLSNRYIWVREIPSCFRFTKMFLCQVSVLSRCSPRYLTSSSWGSCTLFIWPGRQWWHDPCCSHNYSTLIDMRSQPYIWQSLNPKPQTQRFTSPILVFPSVI